MKLGYLALIFCLISSAAMAGEVKITGHDAKILMSALASEEVGAFFESGVRDISTAASRMSCPVVDYSKPENNKCFISVRNSSGSMSKVVLEGKKASPLIDAFTATGLGACGPGGCKGYSAKSIECRAPVDPIIYSSVSECFIRQ